MGTIYTVIIAVLVFGIIVFIHELGHFLMAKACGVKVNEFALGMGPKLLKFQGNETSYALRLFPIGGFVNMEGEDESSTDERAFNKKPSYKKLLILVAGAMMNLFLGYIILLVIVSSQQFYAGKTIAEFDENALSHKTGLEIGDEILSVNQTNVFIVNDLVYLVLRDKDGIVDMTVRRSGNIQELKDVKFSRTEDAKGIGSVDIDFRVNPVKVSILTALQHSFDYSISVVRLVWMSLIDIVTGRYGINQMSGPVGAAVAIGEASTMGMSTLLTMVAFITINVGVFNLLPIPALDGGRLIFVILEMIRKKPVKPEHEGYVHIAGFILLMALMLFVTFNDIIKLLGW